MILYSSIVLASRDIDRETRSLGVPEGCSVDGRKNIDHFSNNIEGKKPLLKNSIGGKVEEKGKLLKFSYLSTLKKGRFNLCNLL